MHLQVILAALLLAVAAAGADAAGVVGIDTWGTVISKPGSYKLTRSIIAPSDGAAGVGVTIKAEGVKLDLNGHSVTGRPDDNGNGRGIGIAVESAEAVEIDGGGGTVSKCRTGIEINRCRRIALSSVYVHENIEGVLVISAEKVRIEHIEWKANRGDALVLLKSEDCAVRMGAIRSGRTGIGINQCRKVTIENLRIGVDRGLAGGVGIVNSSKVELTESTLGRCKTAVLVSGKKSKDNEIRECRFGRPEENDCDLKVTDKAEEPTLIGNEPAKLKRCD
jgi:nitrous oxidase accessory protein NosD